MVSLLTKYLVQFGQVCIPHIGTFEIVQEPPELDVADKRVKPPFFKTRLVQQERVSDHQVRFLSAETGNAKKELLLFGEQLKESLRQSPFRWQGFGTLSYASNNLVFEPESIRIGALSEVPALKVIRDNAHHPVLVGDRQMRSDEMGAILEKARRKNHLPVMIGWTVLAVAVGAIVFFLYQKGFQGSAAGLTLPAVGK